MLVDERELWQHGYAEGWYVQRCWTCGAEHLAAKRATRCRPCAIKAYEQEVVFKDHGAGV